MTVSILQKDGALSYAAQELTHFLNRYTAATVLRGAGGDCAVELAVDPSMKTHHYALCGDGKTLTIRGGNASSTLCGVYEALADAGILFEATGYSAPHGFDLATFHALNI